MDKLNAFEFKPGRRFAGRLPHGKDLIRSIEDFCKASSIQMATFSVIGAVSSATLGAYDQKQQVYATFTEEEPLELHFEEEFCPRVGYGLNLAALAREPLSNLLLDFVCLLIRHVRLLQQKLDTVRPHLMVVLYVQPLNRLTVL